MPLDVAELSSALLPRCPLPPPGTPVRCGFSGGADSVALVTLADAAGCDVTAVHVDHGLRATSAADADAAGRIAAALGVRFELARVDVRDGPNLEARAREARHAALGPGALTGHTADDQAETVLLNLLRGAGLDGLSAMTPGPARPLLGLRRAETTALARAVADRVGVAIVDDASNRDPRFRRNRVRHELLPLLDDIAGRDSVPLLTRTADLARDDLACLAHAAARIDPTDARAVAAAPIALARRALRTWLASDGYPPDAAAIERVLAVARGVRTACEISGGRRVERRHQRLHLVAPTTILSSRYEDLGELMAPRLRGRWALGITPRHFTWILKDKLAICERPGGYGENHRRVRRQEEIIWIRENGFAYVISIIPAPHNLHNYDELGLPYRHRPFSSDDLDGWLRSFYRELHDLLHGGAKVIVHGEEVGDRLVGIMGGYIRWSGLVDDDTKAIAVTERLAGRQLDPFARSVIMTAPRLR